MNILHHKKYGTILKTLITFVYLVFFATQLTCKFYLCASQPLPGLHTAAYQGKYLQTAPPSIVRHHHRVALSLDKRYNYMPVAALVTPCFRLQPFYRRISGVFYSRSTLLLSYATATSLLRGPPVG